MMYDSGEWSQTLPGPDGKPHPGRGYYMSTFRKRADGKWKVVSSIFSVKGTF